ncbi:hypothetical protein QFZ83_003699 [Variovorax sp. W1I1]|uniref:hypothetical protein n=1 Tax=Variovorax sp. W1I1 TaxID=3042309 RepID=UPI00278739BE|nr:hypothetical protein [Variovorax sp. W1I1]MDQ0609528.1 hypothetical protein [Variovorax sp. W1I1]
MVEDLVFRKLPLGGPPNVLVFGEPDEPVSGGAVALGRIALPAFMLSGSATAELPSNAIAAGAIALPAFMLRGALRYDSDAQRLLVGRVSSGWQVAGQVLASVGAKHQAAERLQGAVAGGWRSAAPRAAGVSAAWDDVTRCHRSASTRHQDARRIGARATVRYEDVLRARAQAFMRWQGAVRLSPAVVGVRHQDVERMRRDAGVRWQEADRLLIQRAARGGSAQLIERGIVMRWQEFMRPPAGQSVFVPPGEDPCYVPSNTLVFSARQAHTKTLIFICERHSPPPGTGETVVVPILEAYTVQNSISLVRIDSGEVIEASAFSMSLDADSWTWRWSATLPGAAWPVIRRGIHAAPVEILATVNGVPYRLAATDCSRDRRFGDARVQVQGKGRAAMLDDPYAPILNHASASARSVAQLLDLALTYNGVGIGWDIDFGLTDWTVPGGTWSFQGSHIGAVLDIASAAGAIVQPHATDATLRVMPRYPAAPWNWGTLSPDFVLPAAAVAVEGIQPLTKPDYNRVFVAGTNGAGVLGQVTRSGTAGDRVAQMVTHALNTHSDAVAQRGLAVLSDTGAQANVSLRLQVLPETGLILPGALVRYEDGAETHLGLVRSTSVDWQRPVLRQSITLETHVEA